MPTSVEMNLGLNEMEQIVLHSKSSTTNPKHAQQVGNEKRKEILLIY
jgi:hypothetical protein